MSTHKKTKQKVGKKKQNKKKKKNKKKNTKKLLSFKYVQSICFAILGHFQIQ